MLQTTEIIMQPEPSLYHITKYHFPVKLHAPFIILLLLLKNTVEMLGYVSTCEDLHVLVYIWLGLLLLNVTFPRIVMPVTAAHLPHGLKFLSYSTSIVKCYPSNGCI